MLDNMIKKIVILVYIIHGLYCLCVMECLISLLVWQILAYIRGIQYDALLTEVLKEFDF